MLKIFDDINQYMSKENELEQKEILRIYGMNIKNSAIPTGLKRGRSKNESIYFIFPFIIFCLTILF